MKQTIFEHRHQKQWQTLEQWLGDLDQHKKIDAIDFSQHYRQVCQHLALARERHYTPYLVERLNLLVLRGHQHFYQTQEPLVSNIVDFITFGFPHWIRTEYRFVFLSANLFFGTGLLMFASVLLNPELVYSVLDVHEVMSMEAMYDPDSDRWGYPRGSESHFFMFGFYIRHNITIGFQTFAGGILFGLGTLFFLIFNGLFLGCIAGHLTHMGYIVPFYSFVVGHSAPELIGIVLAGAAGMKLGSALISPGRLTRLQALRKNATESIYLIYGVIFLLLCAAFIEAFWSSNALIDPRTKYTVGGILWLGFLSYFTFGGRSHVT